jgi:hypothetical protein
MPYSSLGGGGGEKKRTGGQIWVSLESDLLAVSGVHVGIGVWRASGGATDHDSLNDGWCVLLCCFIAILWVYCCYLVYTYCTMWSIAVVTLDAGLMGRSQYLEGPATGHLDKGFSWFPCVYKRMLRWFPRFRVTTTCFSYSPPDLNVNLLVTSFIYLYTCKITTATGW